MTTPNTFSEFVQNEPGIIQSALDAISGSGLYKSAAKWVTDSLASKQFSQSVPGKVIDQLIIQPVKATKDLVEPFYKMGKGVTNLKDGIENLGQGSILDGSIFDAPKKALMGGGQIVEGALSTIPATANALYAYSKPALAAAAGYKTLKTLANSKTYRKIREHNDNIRDFRDKTAKYIKSYDGASSWAKMRNKTLQGKLEQKRNGITPEQGKQQGILINVENKGNPSPKDLGRIQNKDKIRAQQQHNQLAKI